MFILIVLLNLLLCHGKVHKPVNEASDEDFGSNLVASMRNDANLDLPADEEYEDLRAELLAYHTALASLSSTPNRRSMISTPCWSLGGICVDHKLCTGFRYLTEVPGCKNKQMVCCFAWNRFKVQDWRDKGIGSLAMPWSEQLEFGGLGVVIKGKDKGKDKKMQKKTPKKSKKKGKKQKLSQVNNNEEENSNEESEDTHDEQKEEISNENKGARVIEHRNKEANVEQSKNKDNLDMDNIEMDNSGIDNEELENEKNYPAINDNGNDKINYQDNVSRYRVGNGLSKKKTIALIVRSNK